MRFMLSDNSPQPRDKLKEDDEVVFNINDCPDGHFHIVTTRGTLNLHLEADSLSEKSFYCRVNMTMPPKSYINLTVERFNLPCESGVLDLLGFLNCLEAKFCDSKYFYELTRARDLLSMTNSLVLDFKLHSVIVGAIDVAMRFSTIRDSTHAKVQVSYVTETSGFLTSPYYSQTGYRSCIDDWYTLKIPPAHVVMVTFKDYVSLSHDNSTRFRSHLADFVKIHGHSDDGQVESDRDVLLQMCGKPYLDVPLVFNSSLDIHFSTSTLRLEDNSRGTKIAFSVHPVESAPQLLPNGLFNCSASRYPAIRLHVQCNLVPQCEGGVDEKNCPLSSDVCRGHYHLGDRCYVVRSQLTRRLGPDMCDDLGWSLAGVRIHQELESVMAVLRALPPGMIDKVAVGLSYSYSSKHLPLYYRYTMQNLDGSINYIAPMETNMDYPDLCGVLSISTVNFLVNPYTKCFCVYCIVLCQYTAPGLPSTTSPDDVSEHPVKSSQGLRNSTISAPLSSPTVSAGDGEEETLTSPVADAHHPSPSTVQLSAPSSNWSTVPNITSVVICADGHVTFDFLSCEPNTFPDVSHLPAFHCQSGEPLPYTLVCDFYPDCQDRSDETFCKLPVCTGLLTPCLGAGGQCVSRNQWCDHRQHCRDGTDEQMCSIRWPATPYVSPPVIVNFDGYGSFQKVPLPAGSPCPETHFACGPSLCLPVYVRCNGVADCPDRRDEAGCDSYPCPGFYRCRLSRVCLHPRHLCDAVFHCPRHDDELLCHVTCPSQCRCQGLSARCSQRFPGRLHARFRYVDASGSGMAPSDFVTSDRLVFLKLSGCNIRSVNISALPNVQTLDLSNNLLTVLQSDQFVRMKNLKRLYLSRNRIKHLRGTLQRHYNLWVIDLSHNDIHVFHSEPVSCFATTRDLNLSSNPMTAIGEDGFSPFLSMGTLDMRRTPLVTFPGDIFNGQTVLGKIYADNYKVCCKATLPENFIVSNCYAPVDEISSCEDLLRSDLYRTSLWLFAAMCIAGNIGSVILKVWFQKESKNSGFYVFVIQLSMSDFLMGVYLVIIGAADVSYRGKYLWYDLAWKSSAVCRVAGFLSFLSTEVSVFIVCLITIDRFIVFRFPFGNVRFTRTSAIVACAGTWLIGGVIAGLPLLPLTSHWQYYSQTGICIPLPITRKDFAGRDYSFAVMIVFNLVMFLLIAAGQAFIYVSIHAASLAKSGQGDTTLTSSQSAGRKDRDAAIARRLIAVVVSDFLCWFPIGLLGMMASLGVPIPGWLNVAVAILILPINSAVNPFLYTYNLLMERRRKVRKAAWNSKVDALVADLRALEAEKSVLTS